jgi:hypothetical protein
MPQNPEKGKSFGLPQGGDVLDRAFTCGFVETDPRRPVRLPLKTTHNLNLWQRAGRRRGSIRDSDRDYREREGSATVATSEAQKRATAKYRKNNTTTVSVCFMPGDADVLAWLKSQPNQAGYVKALIREDMERRRGEGARG